jgi:hypothetical protein
MLFYDKPRNDSKKCPKVLFLGNVLNFSKMTMFSRDAEGD